MKKLNDYIVEQEINENFLDILKRLFKSSGPAMKTNIKNKFANAYPNWYKEYEALEKITDVEEAKKKIEELLAAVDDMTIFKDDNERDVSKITTLSLQKINAEKTKNKELVEWIDSKIKEISEANPKAQKQFEDELKQAEKENGGEGGEEPINPGANAVGQNPEKIKRVVDILGFNGDIKPVIGKLKRMMNESVNESLEIFESNKTAQKYRKTIKKLYNNPKTTQEMDLVLTTLFLAYEKLKGCAKENGEKIDPDNMRALLDRYDNVEPVPDKEVKDDVKAAAAQK